MKRLVIFTLASGLVWAISGTAYGKIIPVPSPEYPTIQAGIIGASSGDTVQVAPGTYYENIEMKSGVMIQGAGAGDDPSIHSIIDGGESGSVITANGVDSAAKLDGFTITNGKYDNGGGMYNVNSSPTVSNCIFSGNSAFIIVGIGDGGGMHNWTSSPTVTNCTFSANDATGKGGGMYNANSSPTVSDCTFSANDSSDQGGGMYNLNSSPTVTNCTFSENSNASWTFGGGMVNVASSPTVTRCSFLNNSAGTFGGGMVNYSDSSPIVTSCIFSGNWAGAGGGGMSNQSSSPTVTNCIFSGNHGHDGGGMHNWTSSPTVTNCTFSRNSASMGGSMYMEGNSAPTVTNSILWGTIALEEIWDWDGLSSFTYCDIEFGDSIYPGTGNINADPLFVDAAGGDLHLKQFSPCIDAGTNDGPELPDTDFEGDPRIVDGDNDGTPTVDMGADEYILVNVFLTPDTLVVPSGGTLGLQVSITNNTDKAGVIRFATKVTLPNGNPYPPSGYLFGPKEVTLNPYQSKSGHLSHTIPIGAPLGTYTYHGYIGRPGVGIMDGDHFDFEVVTAPALPNAKGWETSVDQDFAQ